MYALPVGQRWVNRKGITLLGDTPFMEYMLSQEGLLQTHRRRSDA
jgi:hypothetical protein